MCDVIRSRGVTGLLLELCFGSVSRIGGRELEGAVASHDDIAIQGSVSANYNAGEPCHLRPRRDRKDRIAPIQERSWATAEVCRIAAVSVESEDARHVFLNGHECRAT
jgi:hypothetical protein